MKDRGWRRDLFHLSWVAALFLLLPGCFFRLNLEPPYSLKLDPKEYQPVVLLPILPAPHHPDSGANLYSFLRQTLEEKGYVLVKEADVSEALAEMQFTPLLLLSDPDGLIKLGAGLKAKLLVIGTIPEYRVQKAYWGPSTFQVWDRDPNDYFTLPTYHQGTCQIRLVLRMFESEKGDLVWGAEGTIRAPSASGEVYARKLAERLLKDLPPIPPRTKDSFR